METTRSSHSSSEMTLAAVTSHLPKGHLMFETSGSPADCSLCTLSLTIVTGVAVRQLKLVEEKPSDVSKSRKCSFRMCHCLCGEARCTGSIGGCSSVLQASHGRAIVTSGALE